MRKPSVGRIVHYTNLGDRDGKYPPEVQAAIITGLNEDGTVSLHVFYRTGQFDMPSVEETCFSEPGSEGARGKWAWPPLVGASVQLRPDSKPRMDSNEYHSWCHLDDDTEWCPRCGTVARRRRWPRQDKVQRQADPEYLSPGLPVEWTKTPPTCTMTTREWHDKEST